MFIERCENGFQYNVNYHRNGKHLNGLKSKEFKCLSETIWDGYDIFIFWYLTWHWERLHQCMYEWCIVFNTLTESWIEFEFCSVFIAIVCVFLCVFLCSNGNRIVPSVRSLSLTRSTLDSVSSQAKNICIRGLSTGFLWFYLRIILHFSHPLSFDCVPFCIQVKYSMISFCCMAFLLNRTDSVLL